MVQFWGPFGIYYSPLNIQDAKLVLFADDINILVIDKNIDTLQEELDRVIKQFETWFSNNSLIINRLTPNVLHH